MIRKASEIKITGSSAVKEKTEDCKNSSRRFSNLASKIISELKEHFPYADFGDRALTVWTTALASNDCSDPEHLRAAIGRVTSMTRSKPPSPAQYVAWYRESLRASMGVPSKEIVTKTLLAIYKAADDRKRTVISQLCPIGYKVYREVDIAWLKDTNADQRAYLKEIEQGYKDVVQLFDEKGINAMDEHGKPYFPPVPCFIEGDTDKKAHQRAMEKRPSNWEQTKQFKAGLSQLAAMKALLK